MQNSTDGVRQNRNKTDGDEGERLLGLADMEARIDGEGEGNISAERV